MPKAGELWLAEITFTSGMACKLPPVLVLWDASLLVRAGFVERLGVWRRRR